MWTYDKGWRCWSDNKFMVELNNAAKTYSLREDSKQ